MTVRKGSAWGAPGGLASGAPVVSSDAELRSIVEAARRAGEPIPEVGLLGGDLCRTLGGPGDASVLHDPQRLRLPIDVASVLLDGRQFWFVSHLVARRSWWRGRAVVAMNAQFLGAWDLGPRSHPNDGFLDLSDGQLPIGERMKARRRLPTGSHLPHPLIRTSRTRSELLHFDPALPVFLDGVAMGPAQDVALRVEPDALTVVV